jgi:predicted ATP-binding protein involved in virulence
LITCIEIDGFKTFQNFKLELSPLQVIVGINGAGKSNLFDVLHLLTQLVEVDLRSAFQEMRGKAPELFTLFPDSHSASTITLAIDMLVNPSIKDSWGSAKGIKIYPNAIRVAHYPCARTESGEALCDWRVTQSHRTRR